MNVFRRSPKQISLDELVEQIEQTADRAEAASLNAMITNTGSITAREVGRARRAADRSKRMRALAEEVRQGEVSTGDALNQWADLGGPRPERVEVGPS